jgi:hypothetical protein
MYPHERSLVKRLEGKPFVLLGINSDPNRDELKKAIEENQLTWRSWWDGGSTSGPIATKWNVHIWPTLYLIDADGVIRSKGDVLRGITVRTDKDGKTQWVHLLDEAVDRLVKDIEDKGRP